MPPLLTQPGQAGGGLIADLIVAYARKLAKPPINARLTDSNSMQDFLTVAEAESPPTTRVGVADASGNLYFGAALGEIRVRHPDGHWSAINTGVIHQVTALGWNGHLLVAGYDDGSIQTSDDLGAHWSHAASLPSGDPVYGLNWTGQRWLAETFDGRVVIANVLQGSHLAVYLSKDSAPSDFSEIYKKSTAGIMTSYVQLVGDSYYICTSLGLARLDLGSMKWQNVSLPDSPGYFYVADDNRTMTLVHGGGIFTSVWKSLDGGASWTKTARPSMSIAEAKYLTPDTGVAVEIYVGWNSGSLRLWRYSSAVQDWKLDEPLPPSSCVWMVDDAHRIPTYCITRGWDIMAKHDGVWKVEAAAASRSAQGAADAKT